MAAFTPYFVTILLAALFAWLTWMFLDKDFRKVT